MENQNYRMQRGNRKQKAQRLAFLILLVLVAADSSAHALPWAKQRKWESGVSRKTRLKRKSLVGFDYSPSFRFALRIEPPLRDLPFNISSEEMGEVVQCETIGRRDFFAGELTPGMLDEVRHRRPDFFYSDYLLGLWNQENGDGKKANAFFDRAWHNAPQILALRFQKGGHPMANSAVPSIKIECYHVGNNRIQLIPLTYQCLKSDAKGYVYLPIYKTKFQLQMLSDYSPNRRLQIYEGDNKVVEFAMDLDH